VAISDDDDPGRSPGDGTEDDSAETGPDERRARERAAVDEPGGKEGGDEDEDEGNDGDAVDAVSAETPLEAGPWYRRYLRDHRVHAAVVALFAVYPFVYAGLTAVVPAEMTTLLPGMEVMVTVLFFGLFAMSFDFISGYTGYLSFGHAAFYGVGAYLVILIANGKVPVLASSTPFMISLLLAGLVAVVLSVLIGAVSFRLTGVYFAMITLGFSQVIFVLFSNWNYVDQNPRTGTAVASSQHPEGFRIGVPYVDQLSLKIGRLVGDELALGLVELSQTEVSYFLVGAVVLACYFAMQRIVHSPFGRVMIAIKENEERARAVGYNTFRYKMVAFAISAFFAGIAGGLFAGYRRSVAPDNALFFLVAGDALLAAIIGGFGTLAGPLFGWLFHEGLEEFLSKGVSDGSPDGLLPYIRELFGSGTLDAELTSGVTVATVLEVLLNGRAPLYIGILFVVFVLYVPDGILGTLRLRVGGTLAKHLPARVRAWIEGVVG